MAPKIEKIWGSVFGTNAIQRKESSKEASKDGLSQDRKKQDGNPEDDAAEKERRKADWQSVEKAVADLKIEQSFTAGGLSIEMTEKAGDITVSFKQTNGHVVRTMTGDEFLKLRGASVKGEEGRGKILDQKF